MMCAGTQERRLCDDVAPCRSFQEADMTFGKGALLWLIGIPLPIIILIALLWH
jgi:hypothetical protein